MKFFKSIIVMVLTWQSRIILWKYKPFIIAVTGSVGKTSTKDAIYSAIKNSSRYVRKSEKSLNSDIGLPLTILGVPNAWKSLGGWIKNIGVGLKLIFGINEYPDTLVLEVGADHPGDIAKVVKWLRPHIAVITRVGQTPVHVEFFGSPEDVFREKASLVRGVRKGGQAVLYADEERVLALRQELGEAGISVMTFGTGMNADIRGENYSNEITNDGKILGCSFKLVTKVGTEKIMIGNVVGQTYMFPLLAAAAVATIRNVPFREIVKGISSYNAPKSRMNVIPGKNGVTIIDDTYNSSPDAAVAALATLKSFAGAHSVAIKRRVAILGDMMELGKFSLEQHRLVGKEVLGSADLLVTVGPRSRTIAEEAQAQGFPPAKIEMFDDAYQVLETLPTLVRAGDVVLIKGSQSIRLERVVKALMKEPERAAELLVRQEKEWLDKA